MTSSGIDSGSGSVIVSGARTPIGKFRGGLSSLTAVQLGAIVARSAWEKGKLSPEEIDQTIVGQVLTEGAGQLPARNTSIAAGVPWNVSAVNLNKVCLSGINAIWYADVLIRAGECDVVLALGQESMSQAPFLLPGARDGYGYGDVALQDAIFWDGLRDVFTNQSMGELTEQVNKKFGFTREQQDEFAVESHQKAAQAWKDGLFADEVVPVTIPQRKGDPVIVAQDEGIRANITYDSLAKLKPVFAKDGTITAGNASPLSDGAAAVIVMSKNKAQELGVPWLAEIVAHGVHAGPDSSLQLQPAAALADAAKKINITPRDLDLIEINEAFAAVGLASMKDLDLDPRKVNINGGAIAMGHPLGMSGARVVLHTALQLHQRGGGIGGATLCGGGGQGEAIILRA